MKKQLSPSILSADFCNLKRELEILEEEGLNYVHLDVMDGNFVPNITFGPPVIRSIREKSKLIFDTHLMVKAPERYIEGFVKAGSDIITIHQEASIHLHRSIQLIKSFGVKAGISLNPTTPLSTLDYILEDLDMVLLMSVNPGFGGQAFIESSIKKIKSLNEMRRNRNPDLLINVDGGIKLENLERVLDSGADMVVAGSAIFALKEDETRANVRKFQEILARK